MERPTVRLKGLLLSVGLLGSESRISLPASLVIGGVPETLKKRWENNNAAEAEAKARAEKAKAEKAATTQRRAAAAAPKPR